MISVWKVRVPESWNSDVVTKKNNDNLAQIIHYNYLYTYLCKSYLLSSSIHKNLDFTADICCCEIVILLLLWRFVTLLHLFQIWHYIVLLFVIKGSFVSFICYWSGKNVNKRLIGILKDTDDDRAELQVWGLLSDFLLLTEAWRECRLPN